MLGLPVAQAQQPVAPGTMPVPQVSLMEIPFTIDLRPLFRKAERLLPREAGHWRGWRKQYGVETRYRAWRGPLSLQFTGDVLRAEAHVRYWLQARKEILGGFDLEVGCGVDEPPRQAVVALLVRLGWGPDWMLRPQFRVLPTRFIDRCEITVADIDLSPIIDEVFRNRMEESLRAALIDLGPRLEATRGQATRYWAALQQPVELSPGVWLSADPLALALAPPYGRGHLMHTALGVVLSPSLTLAQPVQAPLRGLPPLQTFFPRGRGMRFDLALDLDLDDLGIHLSGLLSSQALEVEGRTVGISRVELAGEGDELVLTAMLTGEGAGLVEIRAVPVFDANSQTIRLQELDFVYEPEDPDQALMVNLFYQRIQKALEDGANELLAKRAGDLRRGLEAALARSLPQDLELDLAPLRLVDLDLSVGTSAIRLRGAATGSVTVTAH
ncbi:MAG: DUF4403 family protein [Pseudomonadota bacterium]|nr:DUF4403 family protein [Pseudomonadota bacterium]